MSYLWRSYILFVSYIHFLACDILYYRTGSSSRVTGGPLDELPTSRVTPLVHPANLFCVTVARFSNRVMYAVLLESLRMYPEDLCLVVSVRPVHLEPYPAPFASIHF